MSSTDQRLDDDDDLAPRARPGFRSAPVGMDMTQKAQVVAALFRVVVGLVGLGGTLLWLPVPPGVPVVPVLAGVSILLVVTGCASLSRATRSIGPGLTRIVAGMAALISLILVGLTVTLGAGAFGPLRNVASAPQGRPTVTFEPPPGR